MKEDVSLEEITLQGIISSCENLLDDLEEGASINDEDMKYLIYTDNMIAEIQQRLSKQLNPTNIMSDEKALFESTGGRIYCDDEHGNTLR